MSRIYRSIGETVLIGLLLLARSPGVSLASPFAYFTDEADAGKLWVLDTATNTIVAPGIPVGPVPRALAVNPAGTRVYVANSEIEPLDGTTATTRIRVVDTMTNAVVAVIPQLKNLMTSAVAVSPDGLHVYVVNQFAFCDGSGAASDTVSVVDTTSNTIEATIRLTGAYASAIAVSPEGSRVYVASQLTGVRAYPCPPNSSASSCDVCVFQNSGVIDVIDTASNTVAPAVSGMSSPADLVLSPDGTLLYSATASGISVVDTATNAVVDTIPVTAGRLALNPAGNRLYATQTVAGHGVCVVVDTTTNTLIATVPLSTESANGRTGLGVTPDGLWVYAAGPDRNTVSVIDATTNTLAATVPIWGDRDGRDIRFTFGHFIGPAFVCGNGVVDAGEGCDDGNSVAGDGCDAECNVESRSRCPTPGVPCLQCGNGAIEPPEQCDDGNDDDVDACKNDCTPNVCGDGVLFEGVEECDDGNLVDGDGCNSNCTSARCGNRIIDAGEQCDDSNVVDGDGCSSACAIEEGFTCFGAPSLCEIPPDPRSCLVEWYVTNPTAPLNRHGFAKFERCTDGDPRCDFKADEAGVCEFQVKVCLNNLDRRLPRCVPGGVSGIGVVLPQPARIHDPTLRAAAAETAAAVQNALQHLADPLNPGAGYIYAPPLSAMQQGFCSEPFAIDVLLNGARRRVVRVKTRSTDYRLPKPRVLTSTLKVTCKAR